MAAAPDADVVRLTLPADPDLAPVLTTAARVLAVRSGLSGDELDASLDAVAALFLRTAEGEGEDPVIAELHVGGAAARIRLTVARGTDERSLELGR